jgi:hypothetical protein
MEGDHQQEEDKCGGTEYGEYYAEWIEFKCVGEVH